MESDGNPNRLRLRKRSLRNHRKIKIILVYSSKSGWLCCPAIENGCSCFVRMISVSMATQTFSGAGASWLDAEWINGERQHCGNRFAGGKATEGITQI